MHSSWQGHNIFFCQIRCRVCSQLNRNQIVRRVSRQFGAVSPNPPGFLSVDENYIDYYTKKGDYHFYNSESFGDCLLGPSINNLRRLFVRGWNNYIDTICIDNGSLENSVVRKHTWSAHRNSFFMTITHKLVSLQFRFNTDWVGVQTFSTSPLLFRFNFSKWRSGRR